eukprot:GHRR01014261.1.p1 GENE.GHRR01014261.1~~GHRR01014261.1.p1  ORF type:complete len:175 (-),score=37.55 GHRR01014261.1:226-750(-)
MPHTIGAGKYTTALVAQHKLLLMQQAVKQENDSLGAINTPLWAQKPAGSTVNKLHINNAVNQQQASNNAYQLCHHHLVTVINVRWLQDCGAIYAQPAPNRYLHMQFVAVVLQNAVKVDDSVQSSYSQGYHMTCEHTVHHSATDEDSHGCSTERLAPVGPLALLKQLTAYKSPTG